MRGKLSIRNESERRGDFWPTGQGPWLAVALLFLVIAGGTAGYVGIEGWSPFDALYMTIITISTVGYNEVHPLSPAGRVFTVFVIMGGVGTAFYAFTLIATVVVEGGLRQQVARRRRQHMIQDLKDHFILCGYGRIGATIAEEFHRQGVPFVVIERDPDRVSEAIEHGWLAVEADASREEVLKRVGIDRARGLIAAVGTDAENVYAILTARVLRPDLFIIGRIDTDDAEPKLLRAGANRVVSPYRIGAAQMAQTALRPAVVDFVELATRSGSLELAMEQIVVGEGSPLIDRSILDTNLRQRFGAIVVAVQHRDGTVDYNPSGELIIRWGDQLIVLGRTGALKQLESEAQGNGAPGREDRR